MIYLSHYPQLSNQSQPSKKIKVRNPNWLTCILPHAIKVTVVHVPLTRSSTPLMEYETEGELKMLLGPLSIRN